MSSGTTPIKAILGLVRTGFALIATRDCVRAAWFLLFANRFARSIALFEQLLADWRDGKRAAPPPIPQHPTAAHNPAPQAPYYRAPSTTPRASRRARAERARHAPIPARPNQHPAPAPSPAPTPSPPCRPSSGMRPSSPIRVKKPA